MEGLSGLNIDLAEWDRLAATLPPAAVPSIRGAWSGAIERAYILQQAGRRLGSEDTSAHHKRAQAGRRHDVVRDALVAGARTVQEIAGITGMPIDDIRSSLSSLLTSGQIVGVEAFVPGRRRPTNPQRYTLTRKTAQASA